MLSKLSQSKNASPPIVVNVLGSVTLVKLVFLSKAPVLISVTPSGIIISVKSSQFLNAQFPIVVKVSANSILVILQP